MKKDVVKKKKDDKKKKKKDRKPKGAKETPETQEFPVTASPTIERSEPNSEVNLDPALKEKK